MNNDLVSIIIPTYGRNESLENAIESAVNQTYSNIEIIVVDDNNPDTEFRKNNILLMKNIMKKYNNIKYIMHEKNKNGAAARNTGIKHSNGKYIAFLDDDDVFFENKVEIQHNYLVNNKNYKCVGCGYIQNGKIHENKLYGNLTKEILTLEFCFTTSVLFFEKSALDDINGFDERFIRHQDYELLLKYFKKYEIGNLNVTLLEKGVNQGENIPTGKKAVKIKKVFLDTFKDVINKIDSQEKGFKRKVYFNNYFELLKSEIRGKYYLIALKYFLYLLLLYPFQFIKSVIYTLRRSSND